MDLIPRKFYLYDIFDNFITSKESNSMKCDIYEKDGDYHIEMDIPGFEKKDIKIESKNGYLTIIAEKNSTEEEEKKNYIRHERVYGRYERSFYLGDLESDAIEASFNDGTLKIIVPKKEVVDDKKVIEIK